MTRDLSTSDFADPREEGTDSRAGAGTRTNSLSDQVTTHRQQQDSIQNLETLRERPSAESRSQQSRSVSYERNRAYRLRPSEIHTMGELGKFRVIGSEDLARHAYQGQRADMANDIENLTRQGLIRQGTFQGHDANPRKLLTLTKAGHKFIKANNVLPKDQASYHGFVKPKEANHDADIYNLYQKEIAKITNEGGRNPRVILDFELKRNINRDLAKLGTDARPEIAARHHLPVVRGKIPVPDLRIEYETANGDTGRVDLELVTENYRPRQVGDKARAGFSLYASRGEADHLRRVLDQQELTAELLTL